MGREFDMSEHNPLLKVRDVASFFDVADQTVYGWASRGKILYVKINGAIRFERSANRTND